MIEIGCNGLTFSDIEAIFFDKDGTLEDSRVYLEQLARERIRQIAAIVPYIDDRLLFAMGITDSGLDPKGLMAVGSRAENELAAAAYIAESGYDWFTKLSNEQQPKSLQIAKILLYLLVVWLLYSS